MRISTCLLSGIKFLLTTNQFFHFQIHSASDINKICNPKDLEESYWIELVHAADASEQCLNVTKEIFSRRFASNKISIHNAYGVLSVNVLKYFGHLITSLELDFIDNGDCTTDYISKYNAILRYANENCRRTVISIAIGFNPCGLNIFDQLSGPFEKAEIVKIDQPIVTIKMDNPRLNEIFPVVRKLTINYKIINNPRLIDCEINLLDELTIDGGLITNKSSDDTLKNLLKKNTRIQRITVSSPTYRTFQLMNEYLNNLEEINILHSIPDEGDDDGQEKIFFPKVKKLQIKLDVKCHQPTAITFGGEKLQELRLNCMPNDIDYEYFNTIYRYSNITFLEAHGQLKNIDLLKMVGKFPLLTEARFSFKSVTNDSIVKFIEKCKKLKIIEFRYYSIENALEEQLKASIGRNFTIYHEKFLGPTVPGIFVLNVKSPTTSSATKHVTLASGAFLSLFVMHICRTFFF